MKSTVIQSLSMTSELRPLVDKVLEGVRISPEEGLFLYQHADLSLLGSLANLIRERKNGNITYFNRNFHIEPTNICVFSCKFCSYSRTLKDREQGWESGIDEMLEQVKRYDREPVTEVHIVGGVHPKMDLAFFCELLRRIRAHRPDLHIKAFTAVELDYMFRKAKVDEKEGLRQLKEAGLDSLPGGGAEIFDEQIRDVICADKCSSSQWLHIHRSAHELGMHSNATMLYGHVEDFTHRIDHMERLRQLQDDTGGFNTFIPLKFRNKNNEMSDIAEAAIQEDLRCYAMSRIYLDNFNHVKAYWPMIGRQTAALLQSFGVDDLDGTIDDSTRIYSMAGAEEQSPSLSTSQLVGLIKQSGRTPIERDTLYEVIKDHSSESVE